MNLQNLGTLGVPERQFTSAPFGVSQPNYEQIMLGQLGTTDATRGQLTGNAFGTLGAFVTTPTVFPYGRPKAILIIPSNALAFPNGNVTARLVGARTPKNGFATAGSNVTAANYPDGGFLGPLVTLATAVAGLASSGIWITPSSAGGASPGIPDLQWDTAHISLEINFVAGAPTAGNLAVVLFTSPN